MSKEVITITKKEYEELLREEEKLLALEEFRVDNWSGYDDAMRSLKGGN